MAGAKADCTGEFRLPRRRCLVGASVDQVDIDAREFGLRNVERGNAFLDRMRAAQKGEGVIIQRLQAQRHAVDTYRRQIGKARGFDR